MDNETEILRDKIAIAAMTVCMKKTISKPDDDTMTEIAITSYRMADIMMSVKNIPAE